MKHEYRWGMVVLLFAGLQLGGCGQVSDTKVAVGPPKAQAEEEDARPAVVEHLEGAEPVRVTLTEDAAKRIDVHTEMIREVEMDGQKARVIPYAAVLYDTEGGTWTYTNPNGLVFVRCRITVVHVTGDNAVLSEGPPAGTRVVTVGAAELYGAESEFEEE